MKKSTKILLIINIILTIAGTFFTRFIIAGIIPNENGFTFNFSTLGYVGISIVAVSSILGGILFMRFLKTLKLSTAIFFSLAPLSIVYGGFVVYLMAVQQMNDVTSVSVKATLNMTKNESVNGFLWIGAATILYLFALFFVLLTLCKPLSKVQRVAQKLGDGRMKYDNYKIGGGKQFKEIEHSFNKINYNYRAKENKIKTKEIDRQKISKEMASFMGRNGLFELECGNTLRKNCCVMLLNFFSREKGSKTKIQNYVADHLKSVSVVLKKYNGFYERALENGAVVIFENVKNAVECSNAILKSVEQKNRGEKFMPKLNCNIAFDYGNLVFGVGEEDMLPRIIENDFGLLKKMQDTNQRFQTKIVFSKYVLNALNQNFVFDFRYLIDIDGVAIYENLMCYRAITKSKLKKCKNQFESAVQAFQKGEYKTSREEFSKILKYVPSDKTTFTYFNLSAEKSVEVA